jgi:hypothetical protein
VPARPLQKKGHHKKGGGPALSAVMLQTFFDVGRRFETHRAASFDIDDVAGLRISSLAGFARSYSKGAEAGNLESFTLLDRLEMPTKVASTASPAVFLLMFAVFATESMSSLFVIVPPCKLVPRMMVQKQVEIIMDSFRNVKYFIFGPNARTAVRSELPDR